MKDKLSSTLLYAAVLGALCATLLAGAATLTAPRRNDNARADRLRHVLGVLGVAVPPRASAAQLLEIFQRNIREVTGREGSWYQRIEDGHITALAIEFTGAGLWGPVHGVLAMDAEAQALRGARFYRQEETPGLGGEIGTEAFTRRFEGVHPLNEAGASQLRLITGRKAAAPGEVDGITGATITGHRVEAMLNDAIDRLRREAAHVR